ncbi:hypothetical protein ACIRQP_42510 [Streptomyces sp. NPDC102274]|uniref:prealbumin-like fold domain-containing protein n=1 Tax=Streptomyces sp. NPDC102274 TaxID=3366151 RepID=UPI0037FEB9E8
MSIVDPFKPAQVLFKAQDDKSGKLLPGATVNIGVGEKTLLTLTTGPKGTATGELPVPSRRTEFWVKQVKAPQGYDLYKPSKSFTAGPGAPVTVTVTNAKTANTPRPPTTRPTSPATTTPASPAHEPTPSKPGASQSDNPPPSSSAPGTPAHDKTALSTGSPTPHGPLAHTGPNTAPGCSAPPACCSPPAVQQFLPRAAATTTRRPANADTPAAPNRPPEPSGPLVPGAFARLE